jgi:cytochrome P450
VALLAEAILANFGTEAGAEPMRRLALLARSEIESRRAQPRDDYMTTLTNAEIEGRRITDGELEMVVQAFLFAGYETTVHAVGSMMAFLAENPAVQEQMRRDPSAIGAVIEESLRLFPPAHTMFRTVTEKTMLADTVMEEDDKVVLLFSAANRDPSKFEAPEEFRLDRRNPRQHLSFGFGAHFCVGSHLARAEMRIILEVMSRYPCVELAGPPVRTPHLLMGQMMGVEHLPLRFRADV